MSWRQKLPERSRSLFTEGEEVEIGTVIGLIDEAAVMRSFLSSEQAPSPPEKSPAGNARI
jgi:pyruvate/2-oxoglutarate dehydrogenase complex dihydrolipoamide acyltransferase (E2) component